MLFGIDRLEEYDKLFRGKRLGLITSPTGIDSQGRTTIELIHKRFGLRALFSPEHGVRGNLAAGETVDSYRDEETDVQVYSLYRENSKRLTEEMLRQVDAVVYDIQDVGTRYYTFLYTLQYALEDCAKAGKSLIILDRPNPLDGATVEGNCLREECRSFVGGYPLCMRYGLTAGEFAAMVNRRERLGSDLHVIPCHGWQRGMQFPDYGTVWVPPSPNIPRFDTALLYPGTCLFEGTCLSEGRGTALPFEVVGAPFLRAEELAGRMNRKGLPGVWFRPVHFIPSASKYSGRMCGGVQIHVTDRKRARPVDVGIHLLSDLRAEYEEFMFLPPEKESGRRFIDLLSGDSALASSVRAPEDILEEYRLESLRFREQTEQYQLYK
ncbi:exo-beta-N-acetylmuramidase NamZ domain-containing protein [Caproicibacter sp.]|uniref:exo-beta-N-acetylmuramidase NamZ family protein n=1 Tax=Caproicibacter sp. TaxID=2814884 RepID=UPI0039893CEE